VELVKLDDAKHVVISGEWKRSSAGGSHLHSDEFVRGSDASWQSNPKYLLVLKGEGKATVEIVLSRTQWKMSESKKAEPGHAATQELGKKEEKKKAKTIVGTMLGVYIFENKGQRMLKKSECIDDVTFYPKNDIMLTKSLDCKEAGYIIMPCTFEVPFPSFHV
jgi:hypothetical protein